MKPYAEDDLEHVLDHTREVWRVLDGMRLFVTGGTGFFGGWLVESIAWARKRLGLKVHVTVLTRDIEKFNARFCHLIDGDFLEGRRGDVRDFEFPMGTFTHMIFGANDSVASATQHLGSLVLDTLVRGSDRSLAMARHCGASRVLLTSSGAVYGPQPPTLPLISEDFGIDGDAGGLSPYAQGKRIAERDAIAAWRSGGAEPLIARCFAFVGPGLPLDQNFAVGNFLGDLHAGRSINIAGDGTPFRSYLHAADLAAWLWTILARGAPARPYNVGSDHAVSIHELALQIAGMAPIKPLTVNVRKSPVPGALPARYVPDVGRARRELGLDVWLDLCESLRRTERWHSQPAPPPS